VAGGEALHDWAGIAFGRAARDARLLSALQQSLEPIANNYDLILFDCPPGELALQQQAAVASRFLVIPTTPDEGGLDGMVKVARLAERVATLNPQLELLGVVAFRIATNARTIRAEVQADVVAAFGDDAVVFDTIVRDGLKTARDCRARGELVHEYEQAALEQVPFWQALRDGRQAGRQAKRLSQSATGLAADYQDLTREILERRAAALTAEMESAR
jgi:cellulose biosynthesis protein BcsQ